LLAARSNTIDKWASGRLAGPMRVCVVCAF
jgi:hypothetical protein